MKEGVGMSKRGCYLIINLIRDSLGTQKQRQRCTQNSTDLLLQDPFVDGHGCTQGRSIETANKKQGHDSAGREAGLAIDGSGCCARRLISQQ